MNRSSANQAKFRREVFAEHKRHDETGRLYLICYICNYRIDPASEFWDADHVIPHAFDGKEGKPICKACHKAKTATQDIPAIAKSKRVSDKYFGIRRKGFNWPKRTFRKVEKVE